MEKWTQITISVSTQDLETAAAIAQMTVPYGIQIEDYADLEVQAPLIAHIDLIDEELLAKSKTEGKVHIYINEQENPTETISFLDDRLIAINPPIDYSISVGSMDEEDWAFGWKTHYHVAKVGKRLTVCPSWEEYTASEGEVVLKLDPGMAFGTGTHETTRLCLSLLDEMVKEGDKILDIGCGSGILAIAGVLLGAAQAVGLDIDNVAVRTSQENAELNKVTESTHFYCGDCNLMVQTVQQSFSIITSNIVADVVMGIAGDVKERLNTGGVWISSGIIDTREQDAVDCIKSNGFNIQRIERLNGWVGIVATL